MHASLLDFLMEIFKTGETAASYTVKWVSAIISVNYQFVSHIVGFTYGVWSTFVAIYYVLESIFCGTLTFVFDFLAELFNILILVTKIFAVFGRLVYSVWSVVAFALEYFMYFIINTLWMCLKCVYYAIYSFFSYIFMSIQGIYLGICHGFGQIFDSFDLVGSSTLWVFNSSLQSARDALLSLYFFVLDFITCSQETVYNALVNMVITFRTFIVNMYSDIMQKFTLEFYFGLISVISLYFITLKLSNIVTERGFTFPSIFHMNDHAENIPGAFEDDDISDIEQDMADPEPDVQDSSDEDNIGQGLNLRLNLLLKRPKSPARQDGSSQAKSNKDLESELETEKDKRLCVICQDNIKNVLVLPCRHMCMCIDCANELIKSVILNRRICPLCRSQIKDIIDVYV